MGLRTVTLMTPEIIVVTLAILALMVDLVLRDEQRRYLAYPVVAGLLAAACLEATFFGNHHLLFYGSYAIDSVAVFLKIVVILVACIVLLLSLDYLTFPGAKAGEYYALVLFSLTGMMVMISANDLLILFLALQLNSIPLYILAGFQKFDAKSNEASLKYLLMGMLAAIIMLYGMSLLYGLTGSMSLHSIAHLLARGHLLKEPALFVAMVFILGGFTFKIAVVPFHFWAPDVYEGAPTPISGFIAACPKCAGMAAILRVLLVAFPAVASDWRVIFMILAVLSMTIGNVVALGQKNIKRMLAFSSIAHVGYMLVALSAGGRDSVSAIVFYLAVYALITLGAFAIVAATAKINPEHLIEGLAGFAQRSPFLAFAMTTFMMSLLGIPPTPGAWGKWQLLSAAIEKKLYWLAVVAVLNVVISAVYYVNVVRYMWLLEPKSAKLYKAPWLMRAVVFVMLAAVAVIAFYPALLVDVTRATALTFAKF